MTNPSKTDAEFDSLKKAVRNAKQAIKRGEVSENILKRLEQLELRLDTQKKKMSAYIQISSKLKNYYDKLILEEIKKNEIPEKLIFELNGPAIDQHMSEQFNDILNSEGLCIIKSKQFSTVVEDAKNEIFQFLNESEQYLKPREYVETDNFIVDGENSIAGGHTGKAAREKPVINIRNGNDDGMVDLFNADRIFPAVAKLKQMLETGNVSKLINAAFPTMEFGNMNVYCNSDVTETRGFHYDARKPVLKIFVYLTDVHDFDAGPYCFALGSHTQTQEIDQSYIATDFIDKRPGDTFYVQPQKLIGCLASAGDIIVSCQHGAHRGYPQTNGNHRLMAVQILRPT